MKIQFDVKKIYIVLGDGCNLNCIYCSQHGEVQHNVKESKLNPEIFNFIKNISAQQNNRRISIIFFGGEPLLYFDYMKEFIKNLKDINVYYSTITNGKALTQDMVDFINEHNIGMQISWDGPNVLQTRGYDVLKEKEDLLLQLNSMTIAGVMSNKLYPKEFIEGIDIFDKKFNALHPKKHVGVLFSHIRDGIEELTKDIDFNRWRNEVKELTQNVIDYFNNKKEFTTAVDPIMTAARNVTCFSPHLNYPKCGAGMYSLSLDVNGNIYPCANSRHIIGDINSNPLYVIANIAKIDHTKEIMEKLNCLECSTQSYCNNCFLMSEEARTRYFCEMLKASFEPVKERYSELQNYVKYNRSQLGTLNNNRSQNQPQTNQFIN